MFGVEGGVDAGWLEGCVEEGENVGYAGFLKGIGFSDGEKTMIVRDYWEVDEGGGY